MQVRVSAHSAVRLTLVMCVGNKSGIAWGLAFTSIGIFGVFAPWCGGLHCAALMSRL
jgi:hypothetical protein